MRRAWLGVVGALCTCLLGLGLARFAYTPLVPALIGAHWFSPGQAAYLGAANIAGYLLGAVAARAAAVRLGVRATLRVCLVAATAQFFACWQPAGFAWFLGWRFVSGVAGAGLMVLAAPSVLPLVPARHRGLAGGVIFTGIGFGIVASGTWLPGLLQGGLPRAWVALGLAAACVAGAGWFLLPRAPVLKVGVASHRLGAALRWLFSAYAISAAAQVPVILFLADFAARGLHLGVAGGALVWIWFGLGALAGPLVAGLAADRIGHVVALRWLWASQIVANAGLLWTAWSGVDDSWLVGVSAGLTGAGIPGLVVLVLGRSQVLAGTQDDARSFAWSRATIAFALGQAVGAYGLSAVFAAVQRYDVLFAASVGLMVVAGLVGERASAGPVLSQRLTQN